MSVTPSQEDQLSLKTRSAVAASRASSSHSSISEARRRVELSRLQASQKQRAAAAKADAARRRAEAEAQLVEAEAMAEAQAAIDKAEQDALELALLEEDVRSQNDNRSVSRSRKRYTTREEIVRRSSSALAGQAPRDSTPEAAREAARQRTDRWIAQLSVEQDAERPAIRSSTFRHPPALQTLKLEPYDGSPLEWPRWNALFKALVHDNTELTDTERLVHLQSCLRGDAREAVRGLLCDGALYGEALTELERQFGNPNHVVRANLRTILNIAPVRSECDLAALSSLSNTLHCTVSVLHKMHYEADLAATQNLQQVISKLPRTVAWRWGEYCVQMSLSAPTLTDLDRWLRGFVDAGRAVCDMDTVRPQQHSMQPNFGKKTSRDNQTTDKRRDTRPRNDAALGHWHSSLAVTTSTRHAQQDAPPTCACCEGCHTVPQCPEFTALSLSERAEAVRQHGLCWSCLTGGHVARKCPSRHRCSAAPDCNGRHHQLLHGAPRVFPPSPAAGAQEQDGPRIVGATSSDDDSKIILQMLPLQVIGPRGQRTVNVMLDLGSQVTLITERLARDLGLQGPTEKLNIGTIDGSHSYQSQRVEFSLQPNGANQTFHVCGARTTPILNVRGLAVNWPSVKQRWPHLCDLNLPSADSCPAAVLLGSDALELIVPRAIREGPAGAPWAVLTRLGWVATGKLPREFADGDSSRQVNHIQVNANQDLHEQVTQWWKTDAFGTKYNDPPSRSQQDKAALDILTSTTKRAGDRYETGILWKNPDVKLGGNLPSALSRLEATERKLDRNQKLADAYSATINDYITKEHARKLTPAELNVRHERVWYLPHHAVYNVHKPNKTRVVFDAAARYGGTSLNEQLLSGPDLANNMIGILMRFRQRAVALAADIDAMFHQVRVRSADQPALRFLWRDMDRSRPPEHYQMQVLIFGAASSPCSANYVLRKCADDFQKEYPVAAKAVRSRFYVDDYLDSVDNDEEAIQMQQSLSRLLARGGFTLSKWASSSPAVMHHIDSSSGSVTPRSLVTDGHGCERALGVYWDTSADILTFKVTVKEQPTTKRGILSCVSSIFDPLGMLAPWMLTAKCLLQNIWKAGHDWDEEITDEAMKHVWKTWTTDIARISEFQVERCYRQQKQAPMICQLHVFGDASEMAFGVVAYLRQLYEDGQISCALVLAKNRVAPLRQLSIPRLELQAAVMAVRVAAAIKQEHDIEIHSTHYWSDSSTVLQWISNESRRYQNFVANRIAEIQDESNCRSWRHVPGVINPADVCSRGCSLSELLENDRWLYGPQFLSRPEDEWPAERPVNDSRDAAELEERRAVQTCLVTTDEASDVIDPKRYSAWLKLLRVTAWVRRFSFNCKTPQTERRRGPLTPDELRKAEVHWVSTVQREMFPYEVAALKKGQRVPVNSKLLPLSPFMDSSGLIRVGGRLHHASAVPYEAQHQLILPSRHEVTRLVVTDRHRKLHHSGSEHVLSEIRQKYWILRGRAAVRAYTFKCAVCVRARTAPRPPLMADLPEARVASDTPPFTAVGLDFFGPILVKKNGRSEKRYGCIFTCLSTRAVHLEVSRSLDTDSLLMCLRRMTARRGQPRVIYSDNGTNMRGAERELKRCIQLWNQSKILDAMSQQNVEWRFSPPASPHFGGAWERLIRSVKRALQAIIGRQALTDETLMTFMTEVEALLNSRPLTHVSDNPDDMEALTPNHFLIGRASLNLPPGVFTDSDLTSRKRWRHGQRLVDHFWRRWRREYLPSLTVRHRWMREQRNIQTGDLVLIAEDNVPRGLWTLGRIVRPIRGADGRVRAAEVRTACGQRTRAATRLCVLEED